MVKASRQLGDIKKRQKKATPSSSSYGYEPEDLLRSVSQHPLTHRHLSAINRRIDSGQYSDVDVHLLFAHAATCEPGVLQNLGNATVRQIRELSGLSLSLDTAGYYQREIADLLVDTWDYANGEDSYEYDAWGLKAKQSELKEKGKEEEEFPEAKLPTEKFISPQQLAVSGLVAELKAKYDPKQDTKEAYFDSSRTVIIGTRSRISSPVIAAGTTIGQLSHIRAKGHVLFLTAKHVLQTMTDTNINSVYVTLPPPKVGENSVLVELYNRDGS